jgi:hypothetical protein
VGSHRRRHCGCSSRTCGKLGKGMGGSRFATSGTLAGEPASRLPLPDRIFLTPDTFERTDRWIDMLVRQYVHQIHWAMASRTSRGRTVDAANIGTSWPPPPSFKRIGGSKVTCDYWHTAVDRELSGIVTLRRRHLTPDDLQPVPIFGVNHSDTPHDCARSPCCDKGPDRPPR